MSTIRVHCRLAQVVPPTSLPASPTSLDFAPGAQPVTLIFTPRDVNGNSVTGQTVTVVSSAPSIVTVSSVSVSGANHSVTVTPVAAGSANITGTIV